MSLITVNDLSIGYDQHEIVSGLSFSIDSGSYLCIVGENGSGKTTLMRTILGLIPPIRGNIHFGDGLMKTEIGYLPQQTSYQKDFPASVMEIVVSGFQGQKGMRPFYSKQDKAAARANMERLGILQLEKRCYRELSGGLQQRVLLARALCATQKLILLDEPVSGLDPVASANMYELIAQLNRDGITIVMISHDITEAVKYATHILNPGKPFFFGTVGEYKNTEAGKLFLNTNNNAEAQGNV